MDEAVSYRDYDLYLGDKTFRDMPRFLRSIGSLQRGEMLLDRSPLTIDEEIACISEQDISASSIFERTRIPVRDSLRTILEYIFERFALPKSGGVDIGSGATGEMVECLLPHDIDRNSWVQLECNPASVRENQRRHPSSRIVQGSYHDLGVSGLNIVSGLSSLDNTWFVNEAIEEIRRALRDGGYLLHVQDVRPGIGYGFREMEYLGVEQPCEIEIASGFPDPLTFFVRSQQEYLNVGECFRRNLGRAVKANPGMELLFNKWVNLRKFRSEGPALWYFLNILLKGDPYFPFPEDGQKPIEDVSAIVTVARKKAA